MNLNNRQNPHKVTIHTRSSSKEAVMLPIDVVAFSENGSYVTHQRLTKSEDKLTLSLSEGKYRLVAFSGVGNYVFPNGGVTLKSTISHSVLDANVVSTASSAGAQLPAGIALMRGEAEVEVGKKRNAVDIILGHTMSAGGVSSFADPTRSSRCVCVFLHFMVPSIGKDVMNNLTL